MSLNTGYFHFYSAMLSKFVFYLLPESGYHSDLHDSPTSPAGSVLKHGSVTSEDALLHNINSLTIDSPSGAMTYYMVSTDIVYFST